jgi:hypothetical protein
MTLKYRRPNGADGASLVNRFRTADLPEQNPELLRIQGIRDHFSAGVNRKTVSIFVQHSFWHSDKLIHWRHDNERDGDGLPVRAQFI